ncbi:glucan biosynthesis protein G [mine drainage metagenome]|uniref:Glucan biosynthesis protein G n=3 Tax=mine drainage metagenome TaxID=410659 RepID=T1C2Y6_9ZZZZ
MLLTGARLLVLTMPFWFTGCATLSSVHKIRIALRATNTAAAQAKARNRVLAREIQSIHSELVSETAGLRIAQDQLAAATQRASAEARAALQQSRETNANLLTRLTETAHRPMAGRTSRYRWLFARILMQAHALAQKPYAPPPPAPAALRRIDHTLFQSLQFRGTLPFWPAQARLSLAFRPVGYLFDRAVGIHLVTRRKIVPVTFTAQDFRLPGSLAKQLPSRIASSGFEIVDHSTERHRAYAYLSFLGAGYFRARGRGQWWGPLARTLSINTAVPNSPQHFPAFRSFWIVPPARQSSALTLFALLDGSSVTGAYRFHLIPGQTAEMQVSAVLFLRHPVARLGLAPLVSMFLRGRMEESRPGRLHPAVHDSDGLSYETATGRWVWSPLIDPGRLTIRMFRLGDPRGFGFMQRDHHFKAYQALHRHYQDSPDVWIEPHGTWGAGRLELVEIPTKRATDDNIMAFWVPQRQPAPGEPFMLRYTIRWGRVHTPPASLGRMTATREAVSPHGYRTFTLSIQSERLDTIPPWIRLEPSVTVHGPGKVSDVSLIKLAGTRRWQLRFTVPDHPGLVLKAWIHYHAKPLTEVWTYQIPR